MKPVETFPHRFKGKPCRIVSTRIRRDATSGKVVREIADIVFADGTEREVPRSEVKQA